MDKTTTSTEGAARDRRDQLIRALRRKKATRPGRDGVGGTTGGPIPLGGAVRDGDLVPSFGQERLWFLDRLDPGRATYNMPLAIRIVGTLEVNAMASAVRAVVARHESLRTAYADVRGRLVQRVIPGPADCFEAISQTGGIERAEADAFQAAMRAAWQPFDLTRGPLLRVRLYEVGLNQHLLLLVAHHIAADGWSIGLIAHDLETAYLQAAAGSEPSLPAPRLQYADFAAWQRSTADETRLSEDVAWWRARLAGLDPLELPTDHPRPAVARGRGASLPIRIGPEIARPLEILARECRATIFMALFAAFADLLSRYAGKTDIALGTPLAGRDHRATETVVGLFVNTVVLRLDVAGRPSFGTLLGRAREVVVDAFEHRAVPFERLVEELRPERDSSRAPLVQVMLAFQNTPGAVPTFGARRAERIELPQTTTKLDLSLVLEPADDGGIEGILEYDRALFEPATLRGMLDHFVQLLAQVSSSPDQPAADLDLLGLDERETLHLFATGDDRWRAVDDVVTTFHAQACADASQPAVITGRRAITYGELRRRVNRLTAQLRELR